MRKYYFTFGCGIDNPHRNKFVVIESTDYDTAREEMVRRFGINWSMQYTQNQWELHKNNCAHWDRLVRMYDLDPEKTYTQAEIYGLTELK